MASENGDRVLAGSATALRHDGQLLTKVGTWPVVVVWHDGRAYAIEDRCPHMGFPLHRGTCEAGLLTCHWHHARFDLESGCTLDPWADDARAFDVELDRDEVWVSIRPGGDPVARLQRRLREGLEDGLSLVIATRWAAAAEGVLRPPLAEGTPISDIEAMLFAAVTDHIFTDGGHAIDFTNKAVESLGYAGPAAGQLVLPTLVLGTTLGGRSEEGGAWRHPTDLARLVQSTTLELPDALVSCSERRGRTTSA